MILSKYNKINITFCGLMGSGKSIIGKNFADLINFNFIDTDSFIEEKTGKSINEIFNDSGEKYFRELEENIIIDLLSKENYVFSLGGGTIINKNLRSILKKNSFNIYLKVRFNILIKRLSNSKNRPLIQNNNIKKTLFQLNRKREKYYQKKLQK